MASTAAAVERVYSEDKEGVVAVVSADAADIYHLKTIRKSIEDKKSNTTYFAVIKKGASKKAKANPKKTSIAFHFKQDSPGSLNAILQTFAEADINLTKIESRPNIKIPGNYIFHIDFEGSAESKKAQTVLKNIKTKVAKLKVLGSY